MNKQSILIVEDDDDLREAYTMILQAQGLDVHNAANGQEALEYIDKNGQPRVIFLDLRMPVLDGIGFLKKYDASKHKDTEIIVFSNYDARHEIDKAYELGAQRYILKARAAPKELVHIAKTVLDGE